MIKINVEKLQGDEEIRVVTECAAIRAAEVNEAFYPIQNSV